MSKPALHLATLYETDASGPLTTTREAAKTRATNTESLAVARKLGLVAYANTWSIA